MKDLFDKQFQFMQRIMMVLIFLALLGLAFIAWVIVMVLKHFKVV
jgi:hypothetical protein